MIDNPFPSTIKNVAVIAPAGPPDKSKYDAGKAALEQFGLNVITMLNVFKGCSTPYLSASIEDRISDLHQAWSDPTVDLILCARGGYGSAQLLPEIDWELLRSRNIPFLGYSDITALHLAMLQQEVSTPISSPMCCDIAEALTHSLTRTSLECCLTSQTGTIEVTSTTRNIPLSAPVIAANLTVLTSMIGTSYFPDLSGSVLLLEDISEDIYKIDRCLTQLSLSGVLTGSVGVIFGDFNDCGALEYREKLFRKFSENNSFSVFCDASFGHLSSTYCIRQNDTVSIVS